MFLEKNISIQPSNPGQVSVCPAQKALQQKSWSYQRTFLVPGRGNIFTSNIKRPYLLTKKSIPLAFYSYSLPLHCLDSFSIWHQTARSK